MNIIYEHPARLLFVLTVIFSIYSILIKNPVTTEKKQHNGRLINDKNGFNTYLERRAMTRERDDAGLMIVGGNDAPKGVFEDIVCSLAGSDGINHYCGCTMIAPDVALTAAHCFYKDYTVGDFVEIGKFYVDRTNRKNRNVKRIRITKAKVHKKYNAYDIASGYDVMVLKLDEEYSEQPVNLKLSKTKWSATDTFTVVGWGTTDSKIYKVSDKLQEVEVQYIDFDDCEKFWKNYGVPSLKSYFCAYANGKDSCYGDSGGPIFTKKTINGKDKYTQVGLVSFGTWPCAIYPGGVYTIFSDKKIKKFLHKSVCHKNKGLSPNSGNCKKGKLTNIV